MALLIIAACSGTGKSTLVKRLLARHDRLKLSVSHTTRAPRDGECDGEHYHFVSTAQFDEMVRSEAFAEWAEYAGNRYGTSHQEIERAERLGFDLIFEVEIIGARALKAAYPYAVTCFILPPNWPEVERRLRSRQTETDVSIQKRLARGRDELHEVEVFDYFVVNDDLDVAIEDLSALYRSSLLSARAQAKILKRVQKEASQFS